MNQDERRRIKESVSLAKDALLDALSEAESAEAPRYILEKLNMLCGKTEALQVRLA